MALVVQNDMLPANDANAYEGVAYVRAYHVARGRDLTSFTDQQLEVAIVLATQYMDVRFADQFVGRRRTPTQSTEWPRSFAYNSRGDAVDGVPDRVKQAMAEYAYRALSSPLLADPDRDATGRALKSKTETVGPITEKVEYAAGHGFEMPAYPLADKLLSSLGLICGGSSGGLTVGRLARG